MWDILDLVIKKKRTMKARNFVLIEEGNEECPIIGVIPNIEDNAKGRFHFEKSFLEAVKDHFDIEDFNYDPMPYLFGNELHWEVGIEIDGMNYFVRIYRTWIY